VSAAAPVRSAHGGGAGGTVVEARLALGGVADRPVRLAAVEAALAGAAGDEIASRVGPIEGISPFTDTSATAGYRTHLARVLSVQALAEAFSRSVEAQ
jgi:aerobic carbon-monoxide dehydrogenase medium subunit